MPLPNVKTRNWPENSKTTELQNKVLEAIQPTNPEPAEQSQEHHHHREAMPRTTIFIRQKEQPSPRNVRVADKPTNLENIPKKETEENEPEFEEQELEEEMRKVQIDVKMKMKEERMEKVEKRRKEDEEKADKKFLNEVILIEAREGRRLESAKKTEAARRKEEKDAQEWLEEALRFEADDEIKIKAYNIPNPTPSPNQPAKMPTGEEPWWGMEEGWRKEVEACSLEPVTAEVGSTKSNPAGASHHSVPGTMTTNVQETGCKSTKQPACKPTYVHTAMGSKQEGAKEVPRKPVGRQHLQHAKPGARSLDKARKLQRSERMSSSRGLQPSHMQEADSPQCPGALSKLSKLISRF